MYTKAAALIKKNDRYLLVKEKQEYLGRSWNWPQGKVEKGGTLEDAAIRQVKEETGLEIQIQRRLGILTKTFPDTETLHVFLAIPTTELVILPKKEILEAQCLTKDEMHVVQDQLVGEWILEMLDFA